MTRGWVDVVLCIALRGYSRSATRFVKGMTNVREYVTSCMKNTQGDSSEQF